MLLIRDPRQENVQISVNEKDIKFITCIDCCLGDRLYGNEKFIKDAWILYGCFNDCVQPNEQAYNYSFESVCYKETWAPKYDNLVPLYCGYNKSHKNIVYEILSNIINGKDTETRDTKDIQKYIINNYPKQYKDFLFDFKDGTDEELSYFVIEKTGEISIIDTTKPKWI